MWNVIATQFLLRSPRIVLRLVNLMTSDLASAKEKGEEIRFLINLNYSYYKIKNVEIIKLNDFGYNFKRT